MAAGRFPVEAGHVLAFARALGAADPPGGLPQQGDAVTELQARELAVGQRFETVVVADLKRTQIVQYAGASGDYNPLHTDEIYATKVAGLAS
jgi:acyl dehydratase